MPNERRWPKRRAKVDDQIVVRLGHAWRKRAYMKTLRWRKNCNCVYVCVCAIPRTVRPFLPNTWTAHFVDRSDDRGRTLWNVWSLAYSFTMTWDPRLRFPMKRKKWEKSAWTVETRPFRNIQTPCPRRGHKEYRVWVIQIRHKMWNVTDDRKHLVGNGHYGQ